MIQVTFSQAEETAVLPLGLGAGFLAVLTGKMVMVMAADVYEGLTHMSDALLSAL